MNSMYPIEEREFGIVEFSVLEPGHEFYSRKPRVGDFSELLTKTATVRNMKGGWTNAKSKAGFASYIPFDKKVFVQK